jgi:glycosyltransferase involved in cell wall biosynthesis
MSADAFLIPQVFDSSQKRRMETNFPSKLAEFAQFGKPLVVWSPETASASVWARAENRALQVSSPDPARLVSEIEMLTQNTAEQQRLGEHALGAVSDEFNPNHLQTRFLHLVQEVVSSKNTRR